MSHLQSLDDVPRSTAMRKKKNVDQRKAVLTSRVPSRQDWIVIFGGKGKILKLKEENRAKISE